MASDGEALRKRIVDLEYQLKNDKSQSGDDHRRRQLERLQYEEARHRAEQFGIQNKLSRLQLEEARQRQKLAGLNEQALRNTLREAEKRLKDEPIHDEILDNQLASSRIARAREEARSLDPETFLPDGDDYPWEPGKLYLGRCRNSENEVGAATNIHALTVGASGYGKGAGTIIQNLFRWPDNALVIDCKNGENAKYTAVARAEKYEQECFILDPFDIVPDDKISHPLVTKIRFNPLDDIDLLDDDVTPRIRAVAKGMIIRDSDKDEFWQRGAENILCGIIAYVCDETDIPKTLPAIRRLITNFCDENGKPIESRSKELAQILADAPNELCQAASAEINSPQGESYLSGVISSTAWLDDRYMSYAVSDTTRGFHLSALKNRPATIYLSLPFDMLNDNRVFLRLFVSLALKQIKVRSGGRKVLFLLDEFSSLGRLEDVQIGFSVLRDFNCTVWPMIQNWKQMTDMYGEGGADTILAACQIAEFFSPLDEATPEKVSRRLGVNPETEFPYLTPGQYSELVRMDGDLAHRKIVFMPGKPRFVSIRVQGWWNDDYLNPDVVPEEADQAAEASDARLSELVDEMSLSPEDFLIRRVDGNVWVSYLGKLTARNDFLVTREIARIIFANSQNESVINYSISGAEADRAFQQAIAEIEIVEDGREIVFHHREKGAGLFGMTSKKPPSPQALHQARIKVREWYKLLKPYLQK